MFMRRNIEKSNVAIAKLGKKKQYVSAQFCFELFSLAVCMCLLNGCYIDVGILSIELNIAVKSTNILI